MKNELYFKSRKNIEEALKKDIKDEEEINSLIKSIEVNFDNIQIKKYGKDEILESNKDTLYLYTDTYLELPNYNSGNDNYFSYYIMIYNNNFYKLMYFDLDFKNKEKERIYYKHEVADCSLNESLESELENTKYTLKSFVEGIFESSLKDEFLLTNYGLFKLREKVNNYISANNEVINLSNIIKGLNTSKCYYNKDLGLVYDYYVGKSIEHAFFNADYLAISECYIASYRKLFYSKGEVFESYKNLKDIKKCLKSKYRKDIKNNKVNAISYYYDFFNQIPF